MTASITDNSLPRASLIITIIAIAIIITVAAVALRMAIERSAAHRMASIPERPAPPIIDPSEFAGMSPGAYNTLVDYQRARDAYDLDLIALIRDWD